MSPALLRPALDRLDPEKVAYWYFRLNGFLQIENFIVHPERRGGQRTDADLLAVRFPYRAERLFDDPSDTMADDEQLLALCQPIRSKPVAAITTDDVLAVLEPLWRSKPETAPDALRRSPVTVSRLTIPASN
jgi:hypothetical protein